MFYRRKREIKIPEKFLYETVADEIQKSLVRSKREVVAGRKKWEFSPLRYRCILNGKGAGSEC